MNLINSQFCAISPFSDRVGLLFGIICQAADNFTMTSKFDDLQMNPTRGESDHTIIKERTISEILF